MISSHQYWHKISYTRSEKEKAVRAFTCLEISCRGMACICISIPYTGQLVMTTIQAVWCRREECQYDLLRLSAPLSQPGNICCEQWPVDFYTEKSQYYSIVGHNCKTFAYYWAGQWGRVIIKNIKAGTNTLKTRDAIFFFTILTASGVDTCHFWTTIINDMMQGNWHQKAILLTRQDC